MPEDEIRNKQTIKQISTVHYELRNLSLISGDLYKYINQGGITLWDGTTIKF